MTKAVILCVDDEEIPRTLRTMILQQQGYEVVAVASGKDALEALASAHFDLVLSDQMMPGMVGTELARQIKAATPNQPVVIISGVNELPTDIAFADSFISKVEGPEALFTGIAEVLDRYRNPGKNSGTVN
jgi:CheY-like chemotaxis protein